ncbi:nitrate ABC transporter substrate-binding protein [Mycobacterium sp. IS-1742]|uniref:ABC transporter substrate-binding protein n=1 Tax=Mycobacterium sp. IS-1742 TaxID=1772285 RepID=UPI00074022C6|nr:ABC transporter substrate-binding protein [Mycobacterium sp. IS-1742]KUI32439.1 nitrate ABC transporter substrate-binding protein [Mycobacterium sp. IS-1742]
MLRPLVRTALTLAVLASAVACSSNDDSSGGYTLRIGATSPTGTPAGSLGWGDKQGILAEQLRDAGVGKIEYSFFQSGSDVASALFAGAVDVAAIGDNPALRARSRDPKVVLLALDSINSDAWLVGAKGGPTDIQGLVGKNVTAPQGTIRDRAAKQLIDAAGLTGKIQVRDVPTPESIAGLSSGQIDATVVTGASAIELQDKGFPIIDSLSRHGLGSTGTNIALSTFTDEHPEFAEAWRQAVTAVNRDITENFDDYTAWVAQTDGTDLEFVEQSTKVDEFNTEPFPAQGVDQLEAAYEFLNADGSLENHYSVREWAGAKS